MKSAWIIAGLMMCTAAPSALHAQAPKKSEAAIKADNPALEKELYAIELQWMKAEFDKNMPLMESLWTDDFFDVLSDGTVVNKHEMMDRMAKTDRKPDTGAFPDHFKLRAVYGNVALATDHTTIKDRDASGKLYVVREMGVLRMFVKENGKWRVAGAGLVPIVAPK